MKLTNEKLEMMLKLQEVFEDKAIDIIQERNEIEHGKRLKYDEIQSIEYGIDKVEVVLVFYANCSCCSDDTGYYDFPKEWLFQNNWQEEFRLQLEEKQKKEEQQKREKKLNSKYSNKLKKKQNTID